ncbi:PIN domain-containing protein [Sulfobacillus thermosulfidooxidans]|uniref:PIN domain-containing protein n=1 Tax=Sulfobacillus thermosulfidooxidans TaxID=28034 RepID=UPI0006B433A4|nr:PIN domain-containing protein [Sulfobacillus thermosulfidooxidans]
MAFVAFLDACVLFPPNLRDVILTVAETGICQIRWSPDVLDEMQRNIVKRAKVEDPAVAQSKAQDLRRVMEDAFPEAMVERNLYQHFINVMPNDPKDRHVLAAAIASDADILVTANLKDFVVPSGFCRVNIQHPDPFLRHQLELAPQEFFNALQELAAERCAPMDSVPAILKSLQKTVPDFALQAKDMLSDYCR